MTEPIQPELWDQCPGESAEQFMCFQFYLSLGVSRAIAHVARHCHVSSAAVYTWAKAWAWQERAAMYDREQIEERTALLKELAAKQNADWAAEQAELFALSTSLVLNEIRVAIKDQASGTRLPPNVLSQWVDRLNKMRTVAAGGVTERVDVGSDIGQDMTEEELEQFERIRSKLIEKTKGA